MAPEIYPNPARDALRDFRSMPADELAAWLAEAEERAEKRAASKSKED